MSPPWIIFRNLGLVGILMLNSFNFAIEHGVFHRDQKTSLISLLLKKGKYPLDCSSYRPISLIPCDLKIYAKVFASRLEKVIHWFHQGAQCIWQYASTPSYSWLCGLPPNTLCGLSLDAEKAFDRLEWNYMWAVLQCFGFGEHFVSMIKTLYHSPAAPVITGNIIPPHSLYSGERGRGVHLPPYCFVYLSNP